MESEFRLNFSFRVKQQCWYVQLWQRESSGKYLSISNTLPPLPPYPGHAHSFFFSASEMLLVKVSSLLLLCLSAAAVGQQGTTVKPGDDATLQCHCPNDAAVTQLEWTRLEQKSDGYVFFYRNNRLYEKYQLPSFRGRLELRDPERKDGDVSVTLKNVTVNDAGTYKCQITSIITENGERTTTEFSSLVSLTVTDSSPSAPRMLASGNKDEGDKGEGNEDGRKSLIAGAVVGLSFITGFVVFISYKLMNKHTCGSYQQAPFLA